MPGVRHKRGTSANFQALVTGNSLLEGELYLLTDTKQVAVALSANTFYMLGAQRVRATTGANTAGWGLLQGATDGSNPNFQVPEGAFLSGSAMVWFGTTGAAITNFTEQPATGVIVMPFNPNDRVTVEYVPA